MPRPRNHHFAVAVKTSEDKFAQMEEGEFTVEKTSDNPTIKNTFIAHIAGWVRNVYAGPTGL